MNVSLCFHKTAGIQVREIEHFDATESLGAFWSRRITVSSPDGDNWITMYADTRDALLLPHEREQERADAERAAHDDKEEFAFVAATEVQRQQSIQHIRECVI